MGRAKTERRGRAGARRTAPALRLAPEQGLAFKAHIAALPSFRSPTLIPALPPQVVRLSSNENPLGPSPRALKALAGALADVHRYPDPGSRSLHGALAARFGVAPESVLCSNGADEMVLLACLAFLREGDEAVLSEGTFVSYSLRVAEAGARAVKVPLRRFTHDLRAMADAVTPRTRLLFVCNPNNPTGTSVGAREVAGLLARVPPRVLVVLDEAYAEYADRSDFPDSLAEIRAGRPNLLVLRTFAKIYGLAGLRLGYAFGHPDLIGYLDRARPPFNVNALAQTAGLAALSDEAHLRRSRAHVAACRAHFAEALRALGAEPIPSSANFLAVHVGDDRRVAAELLERGFAVTSLTGWGVPGCIRFSFGTPAQNRRFLAALDEVLGGLAPSRRAASLKLPGAS